MDTSQLTRLVTAGVLLLALAAAAWFWPATSHTAEAQPVVAADPVGSAGVTVHVSGAVGAPGLVAVPHGSRVADAIAAAGGLLPTADVSVLNLAAPVGDGEQIRVGDASVASDQLQAGSPDDGRVHINTADATTLQLLPGVGPVLADRIIAYRDSDGPFTTVEDLLDVPGIGEGKLAALRDVVAIP